MFANNDIHSEVMDELTYDPAVDFSRISATVSDSGVVTLRGIVPTYIQLQAAEKAVQRVRGVSAVANELEVHPYADSELDDTEIAEAAAGALRHSATVPRNAVKVTVSQGWVTLEGTVPWDYQRRGAVRAVRELRGIRGVLNKIEIKPAARAGDIKDLIESALRRQALLEPQHISVDVIANRVVLRGSVSSWAQREAVERAAYSGAGVSAVENRLVVQVPTLA